MKKRDCRTATRQAIFNGNLAVLTKCQECGEAPVECHHHDYANPLDVAWLCYKCHCKRHRVGNHTCLRCGSKWSSKIEAPKACIQCKSRKWNVPHNAERYLLLAEQKLIDTSIL